MRQLHDQAHAGTAFDQREQTRAFTSFADDGITFPVTDLFACFDDARPAVDHRLALQSPALLDARGALAAPLVSLAQAPSQDAALPPIPMNVPVDAHVADPGHVVDVQPTGDLFRAPLAVAQQAVDAFVDLRPMLPDFAGSAPSPVGALLRLAGPVGTIGPMTAVALELA